MKLPTYKASRLAPILLRWTMQNVPTSISGTPVVGLDTQDGCRARMKVSAVAQQKSQSVTASLRAYVAMSWCKVQCPVVEA